MSNRRFLYCVECNAVHHVTAFDTVPLFVIEGGEIREVPRDDRLQFMAGHVGHAMQELVSIDDPGEAGSDSDPMKVRYVEVTNGRELLTLRCFRKSIADPLVYEVLPRQLSLETTMELRPRRARSFRGDGRQDGADSQRRGESPISLPPSGRK